jgi:uncharacterized protein (TIGR02147 family)
MKKRIYEYDNYREFLKDFYAHMKATNKRFSFRYFSKAAGFNAPNVLKLVMDGHRNIAAHSVEKFCKALELNKEEAGFFRNLVFLNQASTTEEKQRWSKELLKSRSYKKIHPLKESQYDFFSKWYCTAILQMVDLPTFVEDYDFLAREIDSSLTPAEVRRVIQKLLGLGLLERDSRGKLQLGNSKLATPDEVISTSVTSFHKDMMKRASESLDRFDRIERDISGITFTMSKETMKIAKEMIAKFRTELLELAANDSFPDGVYQLNLQLFPLVQLSDKGETHVQNAKNK